MKLNKNLAVSKSGFIYDPFNGESFSLNPIGSEILTMLQDGINEEDINKILLKKYDVDNEELEKDILDFYSILRQYKLVENEEN